MLPQLEADLVRRDSALPGLGTVLDPEALLAALRQAAPAEVERPRITYVKYSPGSFCRVTYQVALGGTEKVLDVHACRPENFASWLRKGEQRGARHTSSADSVVLRDSAVLVTTFPNDFRLPQLQELVDPDGRERILKELLPHRPELWRGEIKSLRYRTERRYTAELRSQDGSRVLLKAYTPKGYLRAMRNAQAFRSRPPLRVARLLGCSDRYRLLAFEWLPGRPLSEHCAAPGIDWKAVARTGAALRALHAQTSADLDKWTRSEETTYLFALGSEIGFLCPQFSSWVDGLVRQLAERLADAPPLDLPVHGDFSNGQVLVDGDEMGIVDLDSAYRGDPADDLGALMAQMEGHGLRGTLSAASVDGIRDALVRGYRRSRGDRLPERIGLYTAAGLLRRARFAFRSWRPDWAAVIEACLYRIEGILTRPA